MLEYLFGNKKVKHEKLHKEHKVSVCDFGIKTFSDVKRNKKFVEELNLNSRGKGGGKPPKGNPHNPTTPPPPTTQARGVIFLCFEGATVINTSWNILAPTIACAYSGLSEDEKRVVIDSVIQDFSRFDVNITTDENVFNNTPSNRRLKVIVTESYEWYGNGAGGVALINTFANTTDEPCFVFSSLLGYNLKYIAEAISHEAGHTLGLYHHAKWDGNCNLVSEYDRGGNGKAPIMGVGYYEPETEFDIGATVYGCGEMQDDVAIISKILPLK